MKSLLFMVSSMNIGGVEKSLLSLLSVIPKDKYEVTVLTLERTGGFLNYLPEWVKLEEANWFCKVKPVIMQPPQQTIKNHFKKKQYLRILFFIYSYLLSKYFGKRYFYYKQVFKVVPFNEQKFDVAISYQGPTETIDYYIAKKVIAKKKIAWVHFDVSKHVINIDLYTKVYRYYHNIFAVSKEAKDRLIEKLPSVGKKAEVFYNIVNENLIKEMSKAPVSFDHNYNGIKIVTVGRLAIEKGQDLAIKVLKRLREEGYEVRWYCVGEGKYRGKYEKMIEENNLKNDFILLGSTPNPYPYMANADIYVQTSRHEGYCLTLAEAKFFGKPIISTLFTGAKEQLKHENKGVIVDFDENQMVQAIKHFLDKETLEKNIQRKYLIYDTVKN